MSTARHWAAVYAHGAKTRGWYQPEPGPSLRMLDAAAVTALHSGIDLGGGVSTLVDALLARGHTDLTVLDASAGGLQIAQRRPGEAAARPGPLAAHGRRHLATEPPVTGRGTTVPCSTSSLTIPGGVTCALTTATEPGSHAINATFAPDSPRHCSGLPVGSYSAQDLADLLGERWQLISLPATRIPPVPAADFHPPHHHPAALRQPRSTTARNNNDRRE